MLRQLNGSPRVAARFGRSIRIATSLDVVGTGAMKDPVDRYVDLASRLGLAKSTGTDPVTLEQVIRRASGGDFKSALANHLAARTSMTLDDASNIVANAVKRVGGDQAAAATPAATATAVSAQAQQTAAGFSGQLVLKDPVMLDEWARIAGASLMAIALLLATVLIFKLGPGSSNWAYGSLAAIGVGSLIGMSILIMGYKSVEISGTGSPSGG